MIYENEAKVYKSVSRARIKRKLGTVCNELSMYHWKRKITWSIHQFLYFTYFLYSCRTTPINKDSRTFHETGYQDIIAWFLFKMLQLIWWQRGIWQFVTDVKNFSWTQKFLSISHAEWILQYMIRGYIVISREDNSCKTQVLRINCIFENSEETDWYIASPRHYYTY